MNKEQQEALRKPFTPEAINKLPKGNITLDYVGHAWVTDRLLEVDPSWNWEPVAFDSETGLPKFDSNGGLWIKLTVCGVTRYGYGEPQGMDAHDKIKGAIGNAIRVAALRFGVAIDLWKKETPAAKESKPVLNLTNTPAFGKIVERIAMAGSLSELVQVVEVIKATNLTIDEKTYLKKLYDEKAGDLS
jgi:hypothetical protein